MYNVLLISEQTLKQNTPINENVDTSELRYCITQAQNLFLLETLGQNFFNKIMELVSTGDIDLPQNIKYKELLNDQIRSMLINYSYYLSLDNFFMKFVNIGLQSYQSEQSTPIDFKTFQYMKNLARDNAQFADSLLRRYLVFNTQFFPEYTQIKNNGDLYPEFGSAFKAPITLPTGYRGGGRGGYSPFGGYYLADCPFPFWYSPKTGKIG